MRSLVLEFEQDRIRTTGHDRVTVQSDKARVEAGAYGRTESPSRHVGTVVGEAYVSGVFDNGPGFPVFAQELEGLPCVGGLDRSGWSKRRG